MKRLLAIVGLSAALVALDWCVLPAQELPAQESPVQPAGETLEEAWQMALQVSPQLEASGFLLASREAEVEAARADRMPSLSVGAGYTVRDQEPAFRFSGGGLPLGSATLPNAQRESFGFKTNVEVPVYTSGRIGHQVAAARADRAAAEQDQLASVADLKLRVAEAFVAVLRHEQVSLVAAQRVTSLQAHWHDSQRLFATEQALRNDLLAAEVALANANQQVLQSNHRLAIHRAQYNRWLQRDLDAPVRLRALAAPPPLPAVEVALQFATQRRPELAQLQAEAEALEERASATRAGTLPHFLVLGQYAFEENRFRSPEGIAALTFGVEWKALDGARSRQQAQALQHRAASVRRQRVDLQAEMNLQVRQAWLNAHEAQRRIAITRRAVDQAEENLISARQRFAAGTGTETNVFDAALLRGEAGMNFHHAVCDAVLADCYFRHATSDL